MKNVFKICILALFLLPIFSISIQAAPEKYTTVTTTPQKTHVTAGETIEVATTITLAPHWHVYWLNPGDSGLPVEINWTKPQGFEFSNINWATPNKIIFDILANYGYYDKVTLIQTLQIPQNIPQEKITLSADVRMLVCNEICVPETQTISFTLNDPASPPNDQTTAIQNAKKSLPETLDGSVTVREENSELIFEIKTNDPLILQHAQSNAIEFFPNDQGIMTYIDEPVIEIKNDLIILHHKRGDISLDQFKEINGLLVLQDQLKSIKGYTISAPLNANINTSNARTEQNDSQAMSQTNENVQVHSQEITIIGAIAFAFLGGLVLNLMPCVFPVLSMKALSLAKMKDKHIKQARHHGIAYTIGVILSFVLIGAIFITLKHAGASIGWGFQLQNPLIVGLLAYLLFIIGLNLIGLFEISSRFGGIGTRLTQGSGISNSFFTGVLATIVATPCTAPFMGAAMGFAIVQPTLIALLIFAMLGTGLAFPYLLLSFVPAAQKILPRPGAWMNSFKQFLAFPMFASSIWMIWVLDQQAGSFGILLVLLGMLSIAFAIWLARHQAKGFIGTLNHLLFFISLALPFVSLSYLKTMPIAQPAFQHDQEKYSASALENALSENNPIFVEMTAAWCITCKFNHAVALNIDSTKKTFSEKKIRYFIGDWTNYDQEITKYLESFGRNGVPIYVFYGARDVQTGKRPEPILLPQVLTPAIVQDTVTKP